MNIILSGSGGRMGREVAHFVSERGHGDRIVCGIGRAENAPFPTVRSFSEAECDEDFSLASAHADVIVDFSNRAATGGLVRFAVSRCLPLVIATTGQNENDFSVINAAAKSVPVFLSANMSTGVALLSALVRTAAAALPESDIEIVETHHADKEDAPSGTALMLVGELKSVRGGCTPVCGRHGSGVRKKNEIGVHSIRMGGEAGKHTVMFASPWQTVTISHAAHSRAVYADGAIRAAHFIIEKKAGLYTMADLLGGNV